MILLILGIALNLFSLFGSGGSVEALGMQINVDMGFRTILVIVAIVLNVLVVVLAFTKNPKFPTIALISLWLGVAASLVGMFIAPNIEITGGDEQMRQLFTDQINASFSQGALIGFVIAAVIAALISWYLVSSKRVNVTYSHRIKE